MLLTITTRRSRPSIGTNCFDRSRQSSSIAWFALAAATIVWSMIPTGTPANSCSAFWQIRASRPRSISMPATVRSACPKPTSIAALLDSPPPTGSVLEISASIPTSGIPAASSSAATPLQ